jgi:histidine ammonia-lyase
MPNVSKVVLDGSPLSTWQVAAVAREQTAIEIAPACLRAVEASRAIVERHLNDGQAHYGLNTGFGSLAKKRIAPEDIATLQRNLVLSHNAGCGEPLPVEVVRAMMLCLAASLARGYSGVRPEVVQRVVDLLNKNLTPVVPSIGSVGASGDLAPLAAVACVLIGEGEVLVGPSGTRKMAREALAASGIAPIELAAKEGLALINGTHLMAGWGALIVQDAETLAAASLTALAMSIDACRASHSFLEPRLYEARQHAYAAAVADDLRLLLEHSQIRTSHIVDDPRVQDPYSLRAGPTILGAAGEQIINVRAAIEAELGAVTDNPLVFPAVHLEGDSMPEAIVSGANFHGMPVAIPLDVLAIALCHVAGVSERRTYLMTGAFEPESRLKPFLAPQPGLQSGLMIAQYTAAACVNEMIGLANPASVANISTCAGMEDYNSYGPRSAAKASRGIELASKVIAIEALCAGVALTTHLPLQSGDGVERARQAVMDRVPPLTADRPLTADIERLSKAILQGALSDQL